MVVGEHTVVILTTEIDPTFLFWAGHRGGGHRRAQERRTNATNPVGHRPVTSWAWNRVPRWCWKWDGFRNAAASARCATFRFIRPGRAGRRLLAGDVDLFPRIVTPRSVPQFRATPLPGADRQLAGAKTILTINNKKKPLDDVRVRRAIQPRSTARP